MEGWGRGMGYIERGGGGYARGVVTTQLLVETSSSSHLVYRPSYEHAGASSLNDSFDLAMKTLQSSSSGFMITSSPCKNQWARVREREAGLGEGWVEVVGVRVSLSHTCKCEIKISCWSHFTFFIFILRSRSRSSSQATFCTTLF